MPYVSNAQRGKFHVLEEEGKISPATVHEFDEASKGMKLPEHVKDVPGHIDPYKKRPQHHRFTR